MNKLKKILIIFAVLLLVVGIIVAFELLLRTSRHNLTYEEYNALSAEEQEDYFNSFRSIEDFFEWYNKAKQEYEENQDYVEIGGDSDINIGEAEKINDEK